MHKVESGGFVNASYWFKPALSHANLDTCQDDKCLINIPAGL